MVQHLSGGYVFDPADPRSPTDEQWDAMTPDDRLRVTDMLPGGPGPCPGSTTEANIMAMIAAFEERDRREDDALQRAADLARQVAALQAELARLRGG